MPPFHGGDTSNNQGRGVQDIGPQIQALGGDGWWHKATQSNGFRDAFWPACRQNRIEVGLRYGGPYHWLSHTTPVSEQFKNFRDFVGGLTIGEGIQLDLEESGLTDAQVIEAYELWEDAYPGRVFHYMGYFFGNGMLHRMKARYGDDWRWWLPWYTNSFPNVAYRPVMWQWAGGASGVIVVINGTPKRIDSNQIVDVTTLERVSGYGVPVPPTPKPEVSMADICQTSDGQIWSAVTAPDGHPCLMDTGNEGWWVYGVLGYDAKPMRQLPDNAFREAIANKRVFTRAMWDEQARRYGSGIQGIRITQVPGDAPAF